MDIKSFPFIDEDFNKQFGNNYTRLKLSNGKK